MGAKKTITKYMPSIYSVTVYPYHENTCSVIKYHSEKVDEFRIEHAERKLTENRLTGINGLHKKTETLAKVPLAVIN